MAPDSHMPGYVILTHDSPDGTHWDFMLEMGPILATWALEEPPESGRTIRAKPLPDHRTAYLEYEGPISGDRGSVTQWDRGTYQLRQHDDQRLVAILSDGKLSGSVTLEQTAEEPLRWTFSFQSD